MRISTWRGSVDDEDEDEDDVGDAEDDEEFRDEDDAERGRAVHRAADGKSS